MPVTKNRRDGYLDIKDGDTGEQRVHFMNSDFTYHDPVEAEPIPILDRPGNLDHVKKNDSHSGWGAVTFSFKYVDKDIRDALANIAGTTDPYTTNTAEAADGIPKDRYGCVNLEFVLLDEDGDPEETHKLWNVWFNPGNLVFNDADEASTMSASGIIFGKYDGAARFDRNFTEIETH